MEASSGSNTSRREPKGGPWGVINNLSGFRLSELVGDETERERESGRAVSGPGFNSYEENSYEKRTGCENVSFLCRLCLPKPPSSLLYLYSSRIEASGRKACLKQMYQACRKTLEVRQTVRCACPPVSRLRVQNHALDALFH